MTRVRRPPLLIAVAVVVVMALATAALTAFGPATQMGASVPPRLSDGGSPTEGGNRAPDSTLVPARVPDAVPVLLVHGYKGNSSQLDVIAAQLERDGRSVVRVALPEHGTGDLRVAAFTLGRVIQDLGVPQVDVVGFSLGGLVPRAWLMLDDPEVRLRHLVMLATPSYGVRLPEDSGQPFRADCERDAACGQLRPSSSFLRMLDESALTKPRDGWLTVASESDRLVQPSSVVALPGARNVVLQQICPGMDVDHGAMHDTPAVVGLVRLFLDQRLPASPTCNDLLAAGGK